MPSIDERVFFYFTFFFSPFENLQGGVAESRHFPQFVRYQRRVFPVWSAKLQDEMGIVDVRRFPGTSLSNGLADVVCEPRMMAWGNNSSVVWSSFAWHWIQLESNEIIDRGARKTKKGTWKKMMKVVSFDFSPRISIWRFFMFWLKSVKSEELRMRENKSEWRNSWKRRFSLKGSCYTTHLNE